ncbi:MAG TPA: hypothetical protein PKC98_01870, partial [Candidatus Melainabacteria bacterium]|nr:hypothetical protein [Candidatus Melainabacteria bacterium]
GWTTNQHYALLFQKMFPDGMHIVRAEAAMADATKALSPMLEKMGLATDVDSLKQPSWNGEELKEVYPWGTIKKATPEANLATAHELSDEEKMEIELRTWQYLEVFKYTEILQGKALVAK